jgi:predicted adenylyl cyclase CyaB
MAGTASRRNLELKVQVSPEDLDLLHERVRSLTCSPLVSLHQVDTYFQVAHGRLKLREFRATAARETVIRAELIAYARADDESSRWSRYEVVAIPAPSVPAMLRSLLLTHHELVRIDKVRDVALIGHTRVHLDRVLNLGTFVELETVIEDQDDDAARREHEQVISALDLDRFPVIAGSYSDLALRAE